MFSWPSRNCWRFWTRQRRAQHEDPNVTCRTHSSISHETEASQLQKVGPKPTIHGRHQTIIDKASTRGGKTRDQSEAICRTVVSKTTTSLQKDCRTIQEKRIYVGTPFVFTGIGTSVPWKLFCYTVAISIFDKGRTGFCMKIFFKMQSLTCRLCFIEVGASILCTIPGRNGANHSKSNLVKICKSGFCLGHKLYPPLFALVGCCLRLKQGFWDTYIYFSPSKKLQTCSWAVWTCIKQYPSLTLEVKSSTSASNHVEYK